ncbi:MAG: DNA polymerase IV [Armatimonadetes bacterium]|nr:DNA polymerase IV [Armatimonadota bacterium]
MTRRIIHLDMDAFYASIEQRDRPELRGRPVVVGGSVEGRGVVSAASYEARQFGIRSAMPSTRARRLCPHAVFLRVDMPKYVAVSRQVMGILRDVTPLVEPISLDEAFLDVTGSQTLFGDAIQIARGLKQRIRDELQLTGSVGIAVNKLLAKLASDLEKPDGFVVVPEGREAEFIASLPISKLWGVGPATAARLEAVGLTTIGQIAQCPPSLLEARLGNQAAGLQQLARGIDDRPVVPDQEAKSISAETTFAEDTDDVEFLHRVLLELADEVGERLRKAQRMARTVSLKLRFPDFKTISRDATLPEPTIAGLVIYDEAKRLLVRANLRRRKVRLIGVGVTNLTDERQLGLFDEGPQRAERTEQAMDRLRERFGRDAIRRAALLKGRPKPPGDPG